MGPSTQLGFWPRLNSRAYAHNIQRQLYRTVPELPWLLCARRGSYGAITFETFAWRDPAPPPYTKDWCGMPAGTATQGHLNRPDLARVTGEGQLVAHLSARALAMETMHPVDMTGVPDLQIP